MVTPYDELIGALKDLFTDPAYSDLTIACGKDEYRVHKAIVCPRSRFFDSACKLPFQEASSNRIELPDDDPQIVRLMVHYLYHLDYPHVSPYALHENDKDLVHPFRIVPDITAANRNGESSTGRQQLNGDETNCDAPRDVDDAEPEWSLPSKKKKKKVTSDVTYDDMWGDISHKIKSKKQHTTFTKLTKKAPNLVIHAQVYALAEKYGIQGLKTTAQIKFRDECGTLWETEDFLQVVTVVYTTTIESDRGLRDLVVDTFNDHRELLDKDHVKMVIKETDLPFEILMHARKSCQY